MMEGEVEKELEAEEEEHRRLGGQVLHLMSADKFIVLGLALEESQWVDILSRGMAMLTNLT